MEIKKGDIVTLRRDKMRRTYFDVLAVSEIYDSVKLRSRNSTRFVIWQSVFDVRKVDIYQPYLFTLNSDLVQTFGGVK